MGGQFYKKISKFGLVISKSGKSPNNIVKFKVLSICIVKFEAENFEHLRSNKSAVNV